MGINRLTCVLLVYYTQSKIMREEGMFMFGIYYYYRNLILLAVVPAIILLVKVYQKDKVEKESPKMLVTLIMCGVEYSLRFRHCWWRWQGIGCYRAFCLKTVWSII